MASAVQTPTADCAHCHKPIRANRAGTWGARKRLDPHPWYCDASPDAARRHEPAKAYEVIWPGPDGGTYANRDGETALTADEAIATARAIGGRWRLATVSAAEADGKTGEGD
jgi:hypothetical protein